MDESCITKFFITFFSRTARHKKLKQYKVTNMKNKYNVLCILKSGCSYFFIRAGTIHQCIDEIDPRAHDTISIRYPEMYQCFYVNSPRCIIIKGDQ